MTTKVRSRGAALRDRLSQYDEVVVAVVLLAAFVFLRVRIDTFVPGGRGRTFITSEAWPSAILTFAAVLAAGYVIQTIRRARGAAALLADTTLVGPTADDTTALAPDPENGRHIGELAAAFGLLFAYIWAMPGLGFVPTTVLFSVAFLLMLGERRWWLLAAIPTAITTIVLVVFTRLLVVPLPRGSGFFLELSTYLY